MEGSSSTSSVSSRYGQLLGQVTVLQGDLSKTVSAYHAMKQDNDVLHADNTRVSWNDY